MKKIGIMGGTFNPIHNAHLVLAEQAYAKYNLDKIIFMPAKKPPHKDSRGLATDEHRIEMIRLSIKDNPHFELSTLEMERDTVSYTAETLRLLTDLYPDTEFYFIIGGDSLMSLHSWREPEVIFQLSTIIAAGRSGFLSDDVKQEVLRLRKEYACSIELLEIPNMDISSRSIRSNIERGNSIRYYVPEQVYQYIITHNLYQGI